MDQYIVMMLLVGIAGFGMSFMPAVTKRTGVSYSTIYVAAGVLIYWILPDHLPAISPLKNGKLTTHLSELIIIISLMGTGIKIDRAFSIKNWSTPLKLVGVAMLLCMAICCLLGYFMIGLALPSAVLIAAADGITDRPHAR